MLAGGLCLGMIGCAGDGPPPGMGASTTTVPVGSASLAMIQQNVFTPSCAILGCHNALTQSGGLSLQDEAASHSELVGQVSTCAGRVLVVAGNPDASYLLDKLGVGVQAPCGMVMPTGLPAIGASDIQLIRDWILDGAPQAAFTTGTAATTGTTSTTQMRNPS